MYQAISAYMNACARNTMICLTVFAVIADTVFGVFRAMKEKKFNTSVGIDGAIRKIGMIVSLLFCVITDQLVHINLINVVPEEARVTMGWTGTIGTTEFFGLLYVAYEAVSILKNMALCGLPVKGIWNVVRKFLGKYTDELPDTDELEQKMKKSCLKSKKEKQAKRDEKRNQNTENSEQITENSDQAAPAEE